MFEADWQKYFVLADLLAVVVLLIWDKVKATYVFFGASFLLILTQIISINEFLHSFSNPSVITIFLLIYLTAALRENFDLVGGLDRFFGKTTNPNIFLFKLTGAVAGLSSFMNNTPIVALLTPYVYQWGKKNKVSPSKLLIPLSYAAILGGMITVIGTSTNLVLNSFISSNGGVELNFTDFLIPGIITALVGVVFLSTLGIKLLPESVDVLQQVQSNIREYLVETSVIQHSALNGKTVQEAGLRNLDGAFLVEILRDGELIKPVQPDQEILANDRLYFAGDTNKVVELVKNTEGLDWAKTERFQLGDKLDIVEAVIPANSFLSGKTLKQVEFREHYDAAVVAIHRNGERLSGKLGEIELQTGDLLLITTGKRFKKLSDRDKSLYVVSMVSSMNETPVWKKNAFIAIVSVSILGVAFSFIKLFVALVIMLMAAIGLKMINQAGLKKHTNLDLLLILGGAISMGTALISTGAAELIARPFLDVFTPMGTVAVVIALYFLTFLLTSFVTNVAAVSIVFPLAYQLIQDLGLNPTPVYLVLAFGASAAFLTPVGYQTNLMVYGPGNYRMRDFVKIGLPFSLIYTIVSLVVLLTLFSLHG